ncbi:MAG: KH domain-containing protein [Clostridia bacterium]|nr:KH domain-containing protein [Clostridia bacterium]
MKELVEYIVKSLVEDQNAVVVELSDEGKEINVLVRVSEADFGKIIGKSGRVANSIRTVARTSARKQGKRVNIKFTDKK